MKQRFYLYRRGETYYLQDGRTGKQQSLETKDHNTALRLLEIKRQTEADPGYTQFILKSCLATRAPLLAKRTWATVMEEMQTHGKEASQVRCARAMRSKAFSRLRNIKLIETTAEDFLSILKGSKVSVAHYLKRLHNLALGLGWLAMPLLAHRLWPKVRAKSKRGITIEEHQRILESEKTPEWHLFYQLLWEVGASQSDAAALTAENIDWRTNTLAYARMKTGSPARLVISKSLAAVLNQLPKTGPLFPKLSPMGANARSSDFYCLCKRLGIEGVSLCSRAGECPRLSPVASAVRHGMEWQPAECSDPARKRQSQAINPLAVCAVQREERSGAEECSLPTLVRASEQGRLRLSMVMLVLPHDCQSISQRTNGDSGGHP